MSTTELERGHATTPKEAPKEGRDDSGGECHLHVGESPMLCGEKNPKEQLDMANKAHRAIYIEMGDAVECRCGCIRCQTCITLYETFKGLSWE